LQDELAGTENRIKWERDNFNGAVQSYKTSVRSFPTNFIAGMYGFNLDKWNMFKAEEGAQNAPKVNFTS
jgi:LemA protein